MSPLERELYKNAPSLHPILREQTPARRAPGGDSAAPLASGVDVPPDTPDEEDDTGIADEDVYGGVPTGPDDGGTPPVPNDTMVTPAETTKPSDDPFERIRDKDSTYVPIRSPMELSEQWIHARCRTYEPETWKQGSPPRAETNPNSYG